MKKTLITSIVLLLLSALSAILYWSRGSYVDQNGTLVESFYYIPIAFVLGVSGVVLLCVAAALKLRNK